MAVEGEEMELREKAAFSMRNSQGGKLDEVRR